MTSRKIKSVYDARGLETTRTVGYNETEAVSEYFAYDKNRRMTTSTDGLTNATTLAYDQFDRLTRVTDPAGHYRQTVFDKNGNVITREARSSGDTLYVQTAFDFDDDNLLTRSLEMAKRPT